MKLPPIQSDKIEHTSLSAIAVVAAAPVLGLGGAVFLVALIGLLKEVVWDGLWHLGTPDIWDFVADLTGCLIGALLMIGTYRTPHKLDLSTAFANDAEE